MTLNDLKNMKKISKNFSQAVDYSVEKITLTQKRMKRLAQKILQNLYSRIY